MRVALRMFAASWAGADHIKQARNGITKTRLGYPKRYEADVGTQERSGHPLRALWPPLESSCCILQHEDPMQRLLQEALASWSWNLISPGRRPDWSSFLICRKNAAWLFPVF